MSRQQQMARRDGRAVFRNVMTTANGIAAHRDVATTAHRNVMTTANGIAAHRVVAIATTTLARQDVATTARHGDGRVARRNVATTASRRDVETTARRRDVATTTLVRRDIVITAHLDGRASRRDVSGRNVTTARQDGVLGKGQQENYQNH